MFWSVTLVWNRSVYGGKELSISADGSDNDGEEDEETDKTRARQNNEPDN